MRVQVFTLQQLIRSAPFLEYSAPHIDGCHPSPYPFEIIKDRLTGLSVGALLDEAGSLVPDLKAAIADQIKHISFKGESMFVHNAWYIATWSDEIAKRPLARRILGQPLVLFRDDSGAAVALEDRCCHRGAPLSLGKIVPCGIQCGYHGLIFDSSGQCVLVPGDHKVPPGAQVRSYPVVERYAFVWVWMGDASKADHARLIKYPYHNDATHWPHQHTTLHLRCGYLLVVDNLMDLSHLGYVHTGTVGGDANAHVEAQMRTVRTPNGVRFERWMLNSAPPPTYIKAAGFKGQIDRWQEFESSVRAHLEPNVNIVDKPEAKAPSPATDYYGWIEESCS
jgi:phenylpropionate dioxygenase-like ring-hydroxylating dioxygenase large terminal subunit